MYKRTGFHCGDPVGRSAGSGPTGPPWTRCRVHWTTSAAGGGPDRKCAESPEGHIARVRSTIGGGRLRSGPVDHPAAHLFGRRLDRPSAAHRALAGSSGGDRCCWGCVKILTLKKKRGWSSGPAVRRPRRMAPQPCGIALTDDSTPAVSGPPPLVQGGPAWSKVVQGGPLRGASSGAARGWGEPRD